MKYTVRKELYGIIYTYAERVNTFFGGVNTLSVFIYSNLPKKRRPAVVYAQPCERVNPYKNRPMLFLFHPDSAKPSKFICRKCYK